MQFSMRCVTDEKLDAVASDGHKWTGQDWTSGQLWLTSGQLCVPWWRILMCTARSVADNVLYDNEQPGSVRPSVAGAFWDTAVTVVVASASSGDREGSPWIVSVTAFCYCRYIAVSSYCHLDELFCLRLFLTTSKDRPYSIMRTRFPTRIATSSFASASGLRQGSRLAVAIVMECGPNLTSNSVDVLVLQGSVPGDREGTTLYVAFCIYLFWLWLV